MMVLPCLYPQHNKHAMEGNVGSNRDRYHMKKGRHFWRPQYLNQPNGLTD